MVVVREPVALVDRDVELVGSLDEIESLDGKHHLAVALERLGPHLLDIGVGPVATNAVRTEDTDAEGEVIDRMRCADLHTDRHRVARVKHVRGSAGSLQRHLLDANGARAPAPLLRREHVGGRLGVIGPLCLRRVGKRLWVCRRLHVRGLLRLGILCGEMLVFGLLDVGQVPLHDPRRVADGPALSGFEPHSLVAEALHHRQPVGDEQDGLAAPFELGELIETLQAEPCITDREHLVHQENVGVDVDRHGEPEPHVHAGRVCLDRRVDEVFQLRKFHDLVETVADLTTGQPQHDAVDEHVLATGDLRVEPGAQLDQCRYPSVHTHAAAGGFRDPGDELEQRALARTVSPDDPEARPFRHRHRHVA